MNSPITNDACSSFLERLGVPSIKPATRPFDPGYDYASVEAHLTQSAHLVSMFKLSVGWFLAREDAVRRKIAAAVDHGIPVVTGGGPFEIAAAAGELPAYFDLCAELGVARIECGAGFTEMTTAPREIVAQAEGSGLEVEFELGKKHGGPFTLREIDGLLAEGTGWLEAGARQLVIEGRESARMVGLFDVDGAFNADFADRFVAAFGHETVVFEAPNKPSQFALLDHFGPAVQLSNVRLEEVLRVETYRRGLHSDAFVKGTLGPVQGT